MPGFKEGAGHKGRGCGSEEEGLIEMFSISAVSMSRSWLWHCTPVLQDAALAGI